MEETSIRTKIDLENQKKLLSSPCSVSPLAPKTPSSCQSPNRSSTRFASQLTPVSIRRSSRRLSLNSDDFISTPEIATNETASKTLDKPPQTPISSQKSNLSSAQTEKIYTHETPEKPTKKSARKTLEKSPKTPKSSKKAKVASAQIEKIDSYESKTLEKPPKTTKSSKKSKASSVQIEKIDTHESKTLEKPTKTPKSSKKSNVSSAQIEKIDTHESKTPEKHPKTPKSGKKSKESFSPASPDVSEKTKRKREEKEESVLTARARAQRGRNGSKKRVYYKKVVYDGGEFAVGDDVYVKRREDASSDEEIPEVEECRVCFRAGKALMIECDECLAGFHLKCLKPPLKEVPEGDWVCGFCEDRKLGKNVVLPEPPKGKKRVRALREKLLSSDLWATRIEGIWKEVDGTFWFRAHWYIIPEETATGRQPHNLRREVYRTNDFADVEMETIIRHCYVMSPKEFAKANEGDDIFFCEYEYDIHWHSFKRLAEIDNEDEDANADADSDEDWISSKDSESESEEDMDFEEENAKRKLSEPSSHELAANSRKGRFFGLQKIGTKIIPQHVRCHKQTEIERAKQTLLLATLPKSLPCRNKEMEEITSFVKDAICDNQCLGRCLYIHGVPGTGKTMSVLAVMRNLRSELDSGSIKPYCFIEINGLKLASPENIYRVIYEAQSGHRVSWKKALHFLNERFVEGKQCGKEENKPCILLIDELDLLVTRNQSVLYNILDWPTRPNSKLIVIGIANTMDLPEKLLPRISSRMGIHRICFGPYNHHQLQEIITSRLKGINAFEKQAIEFASRKVAAVSGDARRALEICRRAAEIADYHVKNHVSDPNAASAGKTLVGMAEVEAAIQEMFQAPHIQVIRKSCKLGKIFLAAMVHELYKTGMGETTFEKLAFTVSCFCTSNGDAVPGWDTMLRVGCKLGECRIIVCEPGSRHRLQKLQLNFPSDDVAFALKDCKELPWLAKYL